MGDRDEARKPRMGRVTYLKYGFVVTECDDCRCPACGAALNAGPCYRPRFCDRCGQALDFSGVEWRPEATLGYRRGDGEPMRRAGGGDD